MPRRHAVCGLLALGLLGPSAFACAPDTSDELESGPDGANGKSQPTPSAPEATGQAASPPAPRIAKLSDVPVGSGKVVQVPDGRSLVLAQLDAGSVLAYDASCTHQGATVGPPDGSGVMSCPRHESRFRLDDGSVLNGPATIPLAKVSVAVRGDAIVLT